MTPLEESLTEQLAIARRRVEELERMVNTFVALDPEQHPSRLELEKAQERAAIAEETSRAAMYQFHQAVLRQKQLGDSTSQSHEWML